MTGFPSVSRDGPIGPRGTGPPSVGNTRELCVLALSRVAMPRIARAADQTIRIGVLTDMAGT